MKESANVFGSFLSSISEKKSLDLSSISSMYSHNVSNLFDSVRAALPTPSKFQADPTKSEVMGKLLKSISQNASSATIASLIKTTDIDLDNLVIALKNALELGLVKGTSLPDGSQEYSLTSSGEETVRAIP